jgi:hypothetical protein
LANISAIVSDLNYSRSILWQSIAGLSQRELTQIPIYEGWMIKDVLAHILGWDQRVLQTLPLILQNRASEIPSVEVDDYNQGSVNAWRDKSLAEVMAALQSTHSRIVEIIGSLNHIEIDTRRERNGRIVTIRSYIIDIMTDHDREHAAEIELWRKNLEQNIDPEAIKATLAQNRADFLAAIEGLSEADLLAKSAVAGVWSVKDVVGHVADWERLMLDSAYHIHDPSLPAVLTIGETEEERNETLAAKRAGDSWEKVYADLIELHRAVDNFVAGLKLGDLCLRGPYPWPDDQGTLAELLEHIALHYPDHTPDLEKWRSQRISQ